MLTHYDPWTYRLEKMSSLQLISRRGLFSAVVCAALCHTVDVKAQVPSVRATLVQELRIDGKREDFAVLNGGRLGPLDMLALTFRQDAQVRIYDRAGRRTATVGRRGSGPGEFLTPQAQGWVGDTVWIYDVSLKRLTFATARGSPIRSVLVSAGPRLTLSPADSLSEITNWFPTGRRGDGGMLGTATIVRRSLTSRPVMERAVVSVTPSGAVNRVTSAEPDPRWETAFAFAGVSAIATDGSEAVRVDVSDLRVSGATMRVTRLTSNGDTVFSKRIPYRGVPIPRRYVDSVLTRGLGVDREHTVPSSRIPSVFAPVYSVFVEPMGSTYITMRDAENSFVVLVLNRLGAPIAHWPMPHKADLLTASPTHVWLREADVDGIQSVVRYKMMCDGKRCG